MPEHAHMQIAAHDGAAIQISAIASGTGGAGRTVLRLKSWLPEYANGENSVVLAGRELPSQVGATLAADWRVLCVGPAEWLLVAQGISASTVRERIESDLSRQGLVLVELTEGIAVLEVRGAATRDLLSKGCGLDFHPRSFPIGQCARTRFAQIPVVIDCPDETTRFELYVARSYYRYLHDWLSDGAIEFTTQLT